jgi:hypothetical protein
MKHRLLTEMELKATESVKYLVDLLADNEMLTPNVYEALNAIDDIIVEHRDILEQLKTKKYDQKRKQKKGELRNELNTENTRN